MLTPQQSGQVKGPPITVILMAQMHPNLLLGITAMTSEISGEATSGVEKLFGRS